MSGPYLSNHLLIAMPTLADPNFAQTVTLICEHSDRGALGLVLNRPMTMQLGEVLDQLSLTADDPALRTQAVLQGGPVQTDRGFVLHRPGGAWDSTLKVSPTIEVTTSRDVLAALAMGMGPGQVTVALGYAGWDSGQLEEEIKNNAWLSVPADDSIVFELPFEQRWSAAARLLGVDLARMSPMAGRA
jgi:putative transcriptional regulator